MTRPVIALVSDPTSIGVVSSAPIPASRTGWAASRSISATATAWLPASQPFRACWSRWARTVGSPVRATASSGDNTQDDNRDGHRADDHGQDKATRGGVAASQNDEHEQRLPAVVGVPAVAATAHRRQHHGHGDRDQDRGDQQLPGPAVRERGRVTKEQRPPGSALDQGVERREQQRPQQHDTHPSQFEQEAGHGPQDDQADPDDHLTSAAVAGSGVTGGGWLVGGRRGDVGELVQGGRHQGHLCA